MPRPKPSKPKCTWCQGVGWIIIRRKGQIVRREICKNCGGSGVK